MAETSNTPELSVSDLSAALKRTVEDRFGLVRVRGEISNFRGVHSSGHAYFSLKDDKARIDAVIWKGAFLKLRHKPQEGLEVIATGKLTTFPGKSSYQIVIESLAPAGVGALMALLDERRRSLAAEGLFDAARKRPLPFFPKVIGVVTSPTGAVIRDILHRIRDRCPTRVILWPARVQGEGAAEEIAAAITGFNALAPDGIVPRPDVLIIARGGGSLEDLWAFNEEIVVRAAAASQIPLISAVGHETDTTLIDHAADVRAPTPTGAAEFATPSRLDLLVDVASCARRLAQTQTRLRDQRINALRALARVLARLDDILNLPRQRLDSAASAVNASARALFQLRRARLDRNALALARHSPHAEFLRARARFDALDYRCSNAQKFFLHERKERWRAVSKNFQKTLFARAMLGKQNVDAGHMRLTSAADRLDGVLQRAVVVRRQNFSDHGANLLRALQLRAAIAQQKANGERGRLSGLEDRMQIFFSRALSSRRETLTAQVKFLESLSYRSVLARGFVLARDEYLRPLRHASAARAEKRLNLLFADGEIWTTLSPSPSSEEASDLHPAAPAPRASKPKSKPKKDEQGSLF